MHLTCWGPPPSEAAVPVFLLHGWQDTGETFQFMVDALSSEWPLVAPDWRGFGRSQWTGNGYWFCDYVADLDALMDDLSPGAPARLVGHSMGGNIACVYAGVRPERVRCLATLEGFGLPRLPPSQAPEQLCKWLDQVKAPPLPKDYDSYEQLASVIKFRFPRFSAAQADFVSRKWARLTAGGRVQLLGDPRHRWISPAGYRREDTEAMWRQIKAPVLLLLGGESEHLDKLGVDGTEAAIRALFSRLDIARVPGAGHMLHIEKPDHVAMLVETFLSTH